MRRAEQAKTPAVSVFECLDVVCAPSENEYSLYTARAAHLRNSCPRSGRESDKKSPFHALTRRLGSGEKVICIIY